MNRSKYKRVLQAAFGSVWAIQQEKLSEIVMFLEFAAQGGKYSPDEVAERIQAQSSRKPTASSGSVAVIPIQGVISQRISLMEASSGGTSTENIAADFRSALNDESIASIVFDVDSPGGTVHGVEELATEIFQARGRKPMTAAINSLSASAAFWIASSADELAITPGGEVGSVGVFTLHANISKALEMEGIDITVIQAGEFKTEFSEFDTLSEGALKFLKGEVERINTTFVDTLARNRSVTAATVRADFGKGRVFGAEAALAAGMVDRIATIEQTIARAAGSGNASSSARAASARREMEILSL